MTNDAASLFKTYQVAGPAIRNFFRRRVAQADLADDLLQETFLAAAQRPDLLGAARSKRAWLIGIARNILHAHRRRRIHDQSEPLPVDPPARSTEPPDERLDQMREAITRLPEASREVLQLRLIDDLTYAEIAEALELPIGTVRSRIHNAVLRLKTELHSKESNV